MKKYISIILACLFVQLTWAQSGEGYDPQNPGDPQVYYRLMVEASPKKGGSVSPSSMQQLSAGATTYCYASANTGYKFKHWMVGDKVVSTESDFTYTMPEENVTLIAYFDWVGNDGYNPQNPGDPFADGYRHKVTLYATPSAGGSFNSSSFYLTEGKTTNVYAYPSSGYRFVSWKQNGKIVSTQNPMEITMGTENQEYTAQFVYDPVSPGNPGANNFNATTGELVIDDFKAGRLSSAINTTLGTDDNYNKVKSITIIGRMQAGDFGFLRGMSNCSVADISRTTGYKNVPDYAFEGSSALKTIILPYSVESIGNYAFSGCRNLATLYCYATTPPSVSSTTFDGVPNSMKVLVPALSLELYQSANYWKDFVLSALDGVTNTLTISLPEDAKDGRYKNMTLELDNITSGQVSRMLITDRTRYSFVNLIHNTKYNVYVKTAKSVVLGEIQDVEIVDKDVETAFAQLKQPQTVTMSVVNGKGENLTESTDITWFDTNGNYLATGNTIAGYVDGTVLKYRVKLSNDAALYYVAPQDSTYEIKAAGNEFNCVLTPLQLVTVTGYVKNANTKKGIYDASVSISQQTSGKQSRTVVAKTDVNGKFTAEVYNSPASISCAAFDYVNKSVEVESFAVADGKVTMDDVLMNSIVGATVNVSLTYQESVLEGETPDVQDWYNDYQNLSLSVFNLTTNQEVSQISNRYPQFVLMDGVRVGDELRLTLSSKKSAFTPVVIDKKVDEMEEINALFAIKQYGGMHASYQTTTNDAVVGILYDTNGYLQQKSDFANDNTLSFNGLKDGDYTLVTMGKNDVYNSIFSLNRFKELLVETDDYVTCDVNVVSGILRKIDVKDIPFFNEVKYNTIDNTKSSFDVNKSSIVAGNYLTLSSAIELKDGGNTDFTDCKLIIDLPASAAFVEKSVMIGSQITNEYVYKNNVLTINIDKFGFDNKVKFCIIPTEKGEYKPSSIVKFLSGGKMVSVPLQNTYYRVEDINIRVSKVNVDNEITVSGSVPTTPCIVELYDCDILVGKVTVSSSKEWSTNVTLNNAYENSLHEIYARINMDGVCVSSETKSVLCNKKLNYVKTVTMSHFNEYSKKDQVVVFDLQNKKTIPSKYDFYHTATFTFVVDFVRNDTTSVANVEVYAITKNGTAVCLPASYNIKLGKWIASGAFSSANLPVNVAVDFSAIETNTLSTNESYDAEVGILDFWNKYLNEATEANVNFRTLIDEDKYIEYSYLYSEGKAPLTFSVEDLDYSATYSMLQNFQFDYIKTDNGFYFRNVEINENKIVLTIIDTEEEVAYRIKLDSNESINTRAAYAKKTSVTKTAINLLKKRFKSGQFLGDLGDIYSGVLDVLGIGKYLDCPNFSTWCDIISNDIDCFNKQSEAIIKSLSAKCEDGTPRLSKEEIQEFSKRLNDISNIESQYIDVYYDYLNLYQQKLANSLYYDLLTGALTKTLGSVASAGRILKNSKNAKYFKYILPARNSSQRNWLTNSIGIAFTFATDQLGKIIDPIANPEFADFTSVAEELHNYASQSETNINKLYSSLSSKIKSTYKKCQQKEDEKEGESEPTTPVLDPSGYVYEGVFNNRIEGVTTTCYQKVQVEDMYGDLHDNIVKWDAEEFEQKNPLYTDKDGRYAWDVPQGLWQVKYEKEGYETAYSEWLPVPPPQLDVNIGIVQNRQPEVKEAHAYEDGIEFTFDKYMMPAYLTADNIKVSQNGKYVDGKVVLVDEEIAYRDENVKYASTVRFVPNNAFSAGKEVTLVVANRVKSYAGIQMADNFTQSFDIEKEVKSIVADSLVKVPYQGSKVITLYVQPADAAVGKTMHSETSSDMIASLVQKDVVIDENGMAQFEIKGELPGTTGITFCIDGVKATATVIANVGDFEVSAIKEPKASLVSGSSVYRGTKVELTADSKDLKIWYTMDGTCPCDENGSRKQYTEPIVINSDMTLKAMAENADGDASDVVTFIYSILQSKAGVSLADGWNWVSFNMKNDALGSVNTAMASGSWTSDDVVKDGKYVDMYSASQKQWIGTLSKHGALNNTQMYKVRSSKAQTLSLTGEAVHPSETAITLGAGWNYISYLPLVNMSVTDALKGYKAENGDVIKSQDAFATYSTTNGWEGDLTTLTIGRGYMLKRGSNASQVSFTYPVDSSGSSVKAAAPAKYYRYADNMNIIGEMEGINVEDGDSLVAYVNGEIRGASRLERNHKVFLTIQGDEDARMAIVLVRDGEIIATASNMIGYQSNNVLGTSDAPTAITFVTDDSCLDGNIGNLKAIYSINGIKMNTRRLNSIPSGTYIIYSEKNGNTRVTKFIK